MMIFRVHVETLESPKAQCWITMSRAGLQQWAGLCPSLTVTPWVLW